MSEMIKPSIEQTAGVPFINSISINDNGKLIAYTITEQNIRENKKINLLYIYDSDKDKNIQLSTTGSVSNIQWDNDKLYLLRTEKSSESKPQIFYHPNIYGEGIQLTSEKSGVNSFTVKNGVLIFQTVDSKLVENTEEKYGQIIHEEEENSKNIYLYTSTDRILEYLNNINRISKTAGDKLTRPYLNISSIMEMNETVQSYFIIEKGMIFTTRTRDDLIYLKNTSSYIFEIDMENALDAYINKKLDEDFKWEEFRLIKLDMPEGATINGISSDMSEVLVSFKIRDQKFYTQHDNSVISIDKLSLVRAQLMKELMKNAYTRKLDISPAGSKIIRDGVLQMYYWGTGAKLGVFSNEFKLFNFGEYMPISFDANEQGDIAVLLSKNDRLPELALITSDEWRNKPPVRYRDFEKDDKLANYHPLPQRIVISPEYSILTNISKSIDKWKLGSVETITWKASDGLEIEGVLRKPVDFDSNKKYPLVFVVHGGPTWLSREILLDHQDRSYYPTIQFVNNDILVVYPNYRGSMGRGQRFMEIYGENMGFGEQDDIESCIKYLSKLGFVDESKIGSMGWSQGGYISAFLSTHSGKFVATSVGAGISDWKTYYISNDIRQWTTDYLGGTPYEKPEYYKKTAPMNRIEEASTPTLIQHGENDQRVPIANAKELYRALKERGIPTHLFIYKGMPHGITRPVENLSVLHQNFTWFMHHLNGIELNFEWNE